MRNSIFRNYYKPVHPVTPRLPVFVYGTLRTGQGNYYGLLNGNTIQEHQNCRVTGLSMYGKRGFPYCVTDRANAEVGVAGDIMVIRPESYNEVMADLDALEGYDGKYGDHNHYNRVITTATLPTGEAVKVYVYVQAESDRARTIATREWLENGDWNEFNPPRSEAPSWAV